MSKARRKLKKKYQLELHHKLKALRKGKCVSVTLIYGEGMSALLYVFTPWMPRRDIREGKQALVDTFMNVGESIRLYSFTVEYPTGYLTIDSPGIDGPQSSNPTQILFTPHQIIATMRERTKDRPVGINIGALYKRVGEDEPTFRASLRTLIDAGVVKVLANGFVWFKEHAQSKFGITLQEVYP